MLWDESEASVSLTKASKFNKDSIPFKVFCFVQRVLHGDQELPKGYSILNSGRCFRCNRKLTTPESIKTNYGPECIKRI